MDTANPTPTVACGLQTHEIKKNSTAHEASPSFSTSSESNIRHNSSFTSPKIKIKAASAV
jgi:hypothetical protein